MDGVSSAASIIAIAGAGVQIAIKLVTLATQMSTASERVSSIGNEISLTSGVLQQLGELMNQKTNNDSTSIFSKGGLETTRTSAAMCEKIFLELEKEAKKASEQIRGCKRLNGGKIKLSNAEKAKWPFLQPSIDMLRADLREAKGTLMLMLQVTSLALSKKMADVNQSASSTISEQRDFMRAIVALQQAQQDDKTFRESKERELTKARPREIRRQPSSTGTDVSLRSGTNEPGSPTAMIRAHSTAVPPPPKPSARTRYKAAGVNLSDQGPHVPSLPTYSETNKSRELNPQDAYPPLNPSIAATQISDFPSDTTSDRMDWPGRSDAERLPPSEKVSSGNPYHSEFKLRLELQLFLLAPIVREFFDKIELTWSVYNPKMQDSAIRKYIAKNEEDGIPSMLDMLHTLHEYERTVIDTKMYDRDSGSEGSLLSLKRTKTEILLRNITLKDIPGLQFVVERAVRPPGPPIWNRGQGMPYCAMPLPPPPQPTGPYTISGSNCEPQDQPMQLMTLEQHIKKRQMLVDAGKKKSTREWFSHGTYTPPSDVLGPQIPDEGTTDEELFRLPLSTRAQASDKSPSPDGQYTSYDRSESSIRGPTEGRDYQQNIPFRTDQSARVTASLDTFHETPKNDSADLLNSVKPRLRKRGVIQRGSFDKIVEVANPKFDSSESLERRTRTQPDLDLPLHEVPRITTSFSDADDQEDEVQLTPNEVLRVLEDITTRESVLQLHNGTLPEFEYWKDSDSDVTNPSIIQGPVSDYDYQTDSDAGDCIGRWISPSPTSPEAAADMENVPQPRIQTLACMTRQLQLEKGGNPANPASSAVSTLSLESLCCIHSECSNASEMKSSFEDEVDDEPEGQSLDVADEDEDAVVNELLGKYTTLFD